MSDLAVKRRHDGRMRATCRGCASRGSTRWHTFAKKNSALCAAITWAEVSVSNYAASLPRSLYSIETPQRADISKLSPLDDQYEVQLFCTSLTRLQRVQLSKRHSHVFDHHALGKAEPLFGNRCPLLAILDETNQDTGVITLDSRMNTYNCKIACLFYINFMLCEAYDFPPLTAVFLARLFWLVRRYIQDKVPRVSLLV